MKRSKQKYSFNRPASRAKGRGGKGRVSTRARHRRRY